MRRRVIPSLLSHSEREFRAKLRAIEHAAPRCHIDVADGRFVPHRTWANPEVIGHLRTPTTFGVHLMAREPLWRVNAWAKLPRVRRITVHVEATRDLAGLIAHIEQTGKEVGLAVNP